MFLVWSLYGSKRLDDFISSVFCNFTFTVLPFFTFLKKICIKFKMLIDITAVVVKPGDLIVV